MKTQTQTQMYYDAERRATGQDALFLDMVREGMTRSELLALIKLRPSLWGKWSSWIDKLPDRPKEDRS